VSSTRFCRSRLRHDGPSVVVLVRRRNGRVVFAHRRRAHGQQHFPDQVGAHLGDGLILCHGEIDEQGLVAHQAGVGVTVDVGLPLPAGRVWMAGADVLGLEPLELLLRAELVGLF